MEGRHGSDGAREAATPEPAQQRQAAESPSLYDAAAAAELLLSRNWPDRRDAERLVRQHGVERIREAITHADFLQARGEIQKTYRRVVVAFLRQGWQLDERAQAQQRQAEKNRQAARAEQRRREQAERRRAQLQAEVDRHESLWSLLPPETREELHRAVLATLPAKHPAHRSSSPESRLLRPQMLRLAQGRGHVPLAFVRDRAQAQSSPTPQARKEAG